MYTMYLPPAHPFAKWSPAKFERLVGHYNRVIVKPLPTGERPMQKLFYFNTDEIPHSVVTSTARLGRTWYDKVGVGDAVAVHKVGDKSLAGYSVVVAKEFLSYEDVWDGAQHNSVGYGKPAVEARALLHQTVVRACGDQLVSMTEPCFTVLHLLPINNPEELSDEIGDDIIESLIEEANAAINSLDAQLAVLSQALATQGEAVLAAKRRAAEVEATNRTLLDIIAQKVAEQQAKDTEEVAKARETISDIHAMAVGHMASAKDGGPFVRAVTRHRRVGNLEDTTRVEF